MANSRTFEFRVEGVEALIAKLNQLDKTVRNQVALSAVENGAIVVKEAAEYLAPVYRGGRGLSYYQYGRKPGKLSKSIKLKALKLTTSGASVAVAVTDNLGHLLEFGHKTKLGQKKHRNVFSYFRKGKHKANGQAFVAPRPYMRPAIDQNMENVRREMEKVILSGLGLK